MKNCSLLTCTCTFCFLLYFVDNSQEKKKMEDLLKELVRIMFRCNMQYSNNEVNVVHSMANSSIN